LGDITPVKEKSEGEINKKYFAGFAPGFFTGAGKRRERNGL
jgi:hypothetical protein